MRMHEHSEYINWWELRFQQIYKTYNYQYIINNIIVDTFSSIIDGDIFPSQIPKNLLLVEEYGRYRVQTI